ncbi:transglutaminase family protein [Sphingomonas crocodyli]|uniref:Transglutaminase family protein n=1 Tax=Sphingomonas crocodyli TaxID=1979270 RepID=A0A437MA54_9SPHN|nr:transglutaminase family protein [Sphingomonas crocodyli]RVT94519.1 transglutaminase family protein [Sphingomonas crocodyli]
MRILISHRTEYRFTEPQARVVQLLRMTPDSHLGQSVVDWRIEVDCDARLKSRRDGFGNIVSMLYLEGPIDCIGLSVTGEVLTEDRAGVVNGAANLLPAGVFLRPTDLTRTNAAIDLIGAAHGISADDPLGAAHALCGEIHERIACTPDRSTDMRTAAEILEAGAGCSMDMAHVMIAAARAAGFPARFVNGYLCDEEAAPQQRQAPHFWAELHVPDYGWIGFDPACERCPDENYVRVAIGLDYRDAAPISGARIGGGHEVLRVGVDVSSEAVGQLQTQN